MPIITHRNDLRQHRFSAPFSLPGRSRSPILVNIMVFNRTGQDPHSKPLPSGRLPLSSVSARPIHPFSGWSQCQFKMADDACPGNGAHRPSRREQMEPCRLMVEEGADLRQIAWVMQFPLATVKKTLAKQDRQQITVTAHHRDLPLLARCEPF